MYTSNKKRNNIVKRIDTRKNYDYDYSYKLNNSKLSRKAEGGKIHNASL